MPGRFDYYEHLTTEQQATYRKSDAVGHIAVPDLPALLPLVASLSDALASGKRFATAKASTALVLALCRQLGVPPVAVTVRNVRPAISGGELHGLYTFAEKGKTPKIEVWMRTGAQEKVVKFKTFLRTLLHEVCHHLDVTMLGLEDSFHTEGFFRRESSLVRQLAPPSAPQRQSAPKQKTNEKPAAPAQRQLSLFGESVARART